MFDMMGTLFRLDRLRDELALHGLPGQAADLWFAASLRDYMAISYAGGFVPLGEVLPARLPSVLESYGRSIDPDDAERIMASLTELEPDPGAEAGCRALTEAGWRCIVLTNGSRGLAKGLLERSGLDRFMHAVLSCEAVKLAKPHHAVYELALERVEGEPWMVAAHAWDLYGARGAGMRTAYVTQGGDPPPATFPRPDVTGADIAEAARAMIAASG